MSEAIEDAPVRPPCYVFTREQKATISAARSRFLSARALCYVATQTGATPEIVAVLGNECQRLLDEEVAIQYGFVPTGHSHEAPLVLSPERPHTAFQRAVDDLKAHYEAPHV